MKTPEIYLRAPSPQIPPLPYLEGSGLASENNFLESKLPLPIRVAECLLPCRSSTPTTYKPSTFVFSQNLCLVLLNGSLTFPGFHAKDKTFSGEERKKQDQQILNLCWLRHISFQKVPNYHVRPQKQNFQRNILDGLYSVVCL